MTVLFENEINLNFGIHFDFSGGSDPDIARLGHLLSSALISPSHDFGKIHPKDIPHWVNHLQRAFDSMSHEAVKRDAKNIDVVHLYPHPKYLTDHLTSNEGHPNFKKWSKQANPGNWLGSFGQSANDDQTALRLAVPDKRIFRHELYHAVDADRSIAESRRWQNLYEKDIKANKPLRGSFGLLKVIPKLSDYAKTNAYEGFAESGRLLHDIGPDEFKKAHPRIHGFFEDNGLLPTKADIDRKEPLVELFSHSLYDNGGKLHADGMVASAKKKVDFDCEPSNRISVLFDNTNSSADFADNPPKPSLPEADELGFFSNLKNAVEQLPQKKIPKQDFRKHLAKYQGTGYINKPSDPTKYPPNHGDLGNVLHVPGHESEVVGLEDYLKDKPVVNKEDALKHISKNTPKLEEVSQNNLEAKTQWWARHRSHRGREGVGYDEPFETEEEANQHVNELLDDWVQRSLPDHGVFENKDEHGEPVYTINGVDDEEFHDENEAEERAQQLKDQFEKEFRQDNHNEWNVTEEKDEDSHHGPQTEEYSLEGPKQDYDEIHLTVPDLADDIKPKPLLEGVTAKVEELPNNTGGWYKKVTILDNKGQALKNMAFHESTATPDWYNKTPEQFASEYTKEHNDIISKENAKAAAEKRQWADGHGFFEHIKNPVGRIRHDTRTDAEGKKMFFLEEVQPPKEDEPMPQWLRDKSYDILLKHAVKKAVASGADRLGWTTGKTQADRYGLSKHVDRLQWSPSSDPERAANGEGRLIGHKDGRASLNMWVGPKSEHEATNLEAVVGKDLAEKLRSAEPDESGFRNVHIPEGQEFGGQGLKDAYNKMIPSKLKGILKKQGIQIKPSSVPLETSGHPYIGEGNRQVGDKYEPHYYVEGKQGETTWFDTREEAQAFLEKHRTALTAKHEPVWSIELTPAVKEWAKKPTPMFSNEEDTPKNVVDFDNAVNRISVYFDNAVRPKTVSIVSLMADFSKDEPSTKNLSPLGLYSNIEEAVKQWKPKGTPHELRKHLAKTAGTGYSDKLEYEMEPHPQYGQLDEKGKVYPKERPKNAWEKRSGATDETPMLANINTGKQQLASSHKEADEWLKANHEKVPLPWKELQGASNKEKTWLVPGNEADHVKLEDLLKGKKQVTKEEVLAHVKKHSVPFSEVDQNKLLGEGVDVSDLQERLDDLAKRHQSTFRPVELGNKYIVKDANGEGDDEEFTDEDQAEERAQMLNDEHYDRYLDQKEEEWAPELTEEQGFKYITDKQKALAYLHKRGLKPEHAAKEIQKSYGFYKDSKKWKSENWHQIHSDVWDAEHEGNSSRELTKHTGDVLEDVSERLNREYAPKLKPLEEKLVRSEKLQQAIDEGKGNPEKMLAMLQKLGTPEQLKEQINDLNYEKNDHLHALESALEVEGNPDFQEAEWYIPTKDMSEGIKRDFQKYQEENPTGFNSKRDAERFLNDFLRNGEHTLKNYSEAQPWNVHEGEGGQELTDPEAIRQHLMNQIDDEMRERRVNASSDPDAGPKYEAYSMPDELGKIPSTYNEIHTTAPREKPPTPTVEELMARLGDDLEDKDPSHYRLVLRGGGYPALEHTETGAQHEPSDYIIDPETGQHVYEPLGQSKSWKDEHNDYKHVENPMSRLRYDIRPDAEGKKNFFLQEIQAPKPGIQATMPEHVSKRLYQVGLKRALTKAIEEGAEKFSWTTGDQQRERYNLRNKVDKLEWKPDPNNAEYGVLTGSKNGKFVLTENIRQNGRAGSLAEVIGPELAKELQAQELKSVPRYSILPSHYHLGPSQALLKDNQTGQIHSLDKEKAKDLAEGPDRFTHPAMVEGKKLDIGGMGHKRSYDKMIPDMLRDIVKKAAKEHGIALPKEQLDKAKTTMKVKAKELGIENEGGGKFAVYAIYDKNNLHRKVLKDELDSEEARKYMAEVKANGMIVPEEMHSLVLTPEIKAAIAGGLPSFSIAQLMEEAGVVDFTEGSVSFDQKSTDKRIRSLKREFEGLDTATELRRDLIRELRAASEQALVEVFGSNAPKDAKALVRDFLSTQRAYAYNYAAEAKYEGVQSHRTKLYAASLHGLYQSLKRLKAEMGGSQWERRLLGPSENGCSTCKKLAAQGWVPIGTLPKIGDTPCKVNCRCRFDFSVQSKKPSR